MNGKLSFWDWWGSLSDQEKKETGRCMECGTHECSDGWMNNE